MVRLLIRRWHSVHVDHGLCPTLTDPLHIYQNYVSRGLLRQDEAQLRAAIQFQKLYKRVKDYKPHGDTQVKINSYIRQIELADRKKNVLGLRYSYRPKWFEKIQDNEKKDLIKVLTDEEELANFPSPMGLLVNGEVGCGKSMLMDIFAHSLPHSSKCRWHYNNFILWVYNEIHIIYERRKLDNQDNHTCLSLENEFILLEVASKMIEKNTILMLDEFMLPDLASAKIVKILFTYFFKLGGVLVATSNRLPEQLYSTAFNKTQFKSFEAVLKLRCETYDMRSKQDYRQILSNEAKGQIVSHLVIKKDDPEESQWAKLIAKATNYEMGNPATLTVYGRKLPIPWHARGIAKFDFSDLCQTLFGPGDYISLASNYHTFIIDNVPVLTIRMRNDARRFITFLDAIYEARCQLIIRSEAGPDDLFFPDLKTSESSSEGSNSLDVQNEEMFSRTQMYLSNPYRPNVSSYDSGVGSRDFESAQHNTIDRPMCKIDNDFQNMKRFTGEDEMFAYKRAVSRIREMTGSEMWRESRDWLPIDASMRPWEKLEDVVLEPESEPNNMSLLEQLQKSAAETESELGDHLLENPNIHDPSKFTKPGELHSDRDVSNQMLVHRIPPDYSDRRAHGPIFPFVSRFSQSFKDAPVFKKMHFWSVGVWGNGNRLKDEISKRWIKGNNHISE
ncbi:BA75_00147T0 [Komagataella pastoris]|uniref:BA75_00147T0 n=1 Tax=Komagataella pastoris TaxID=4922 RepID=A0A1B2J5R7_PICPA|nr:BA75_00147T0 [Komagataella pastoris]